MLSVSEVEKVLALPDVKDVFGLRDRALLETLYSTGIRRKELIGLGLFDIDTERGTLHVREGKGGRERVVPIGERARLWIDKYVSDARTELLVPPDPGNVSAFGLLTVDVKNDYVQTRVALDELVDPAKELQNIGCNLPRA